MNVFPIRLPALRERGKDIPMLVRYFAQKHSEGKGKQIERIPAETMQVLERWHWPGNVRELENLIERAVILTRGTVLNVPLAELKPSPGTRRRSGRRGHARRRRARSHSEGAAGGA